jgi:glutamate/aspartate transport system substrate-binding protein
MLTRIRNAVMAGHAQVGMPNSKIKVEIARILEIPPSQVLDAASFYTHYWRHPRGRKVVVVRGTTNEEAMRHLATTLARGATIVVADDYAQGLAMLAAGEADAFAGDDILLAAFVAERGLQRQYAVVGELLSYEPYGIMFARDDPALAQAVDAAFRRLAASRELRWIYNKWFLRALPSGVRLGLPMSAELQRSFEILGLPPE